MNLKLKDIAQIQSGVYAKPGKDGDVLYLQSGHIDDSGVIQRNLQPSVALDHKLTNFILNDGDILFSAKGNRNISVIYSSQLGKAVASTTFLVLRPIGKNVLPEYLAWFLNHPRIQLFLKTHAKGASPPSISKETLQDLQVEVPDIQTQKEILLIHTLRKKEQQLIQQIEELKEQSLQYRLYHSSTR